MGGLVQRAAVLRGKTLAGCRTPAWSLAGCRVQHLLANLKAQAAQKTQNTKNALFGVGRFQRILLQNGAVTKR